MNDSLRLYGTTEAVAPTRRIVAGPVSLTLDGDALRHVRLDGAEAIRSVAFLVRDRDWGTVSPELIDETVVSRPGGTEIVRTTVYSSGSASLRVEAMIQVTAAGVTFSAEATATGTFETNRTGFTVLHPIAGVSGHALTVEHTDGSIEDARFPDLIEPAQPFLDLRMLSHRVGNWRVDCRMEGDVFEMEDQRQWGDASFKTYVRPLTLPWPYAIPSGTAIRQTIVISWHEAVPAAAAAHAVQAESKGRVPQTALSVTADEARHAVLRPDDLRSISPQRLLCHFDAAAGHGLRELSAFAALQEAFPAVCDLEFVARLGGPPAAEFESVARLMVETGFRPSSILVCPSVDRLSTPPGSVWPDCPPLEDVYAAARGAFPDVVLGGGMVSFFPELNRKRPPLDLIDFVSHGLCPIVHAADDLSVMESLEAVPHITRSARAIAKDRHYRIGPSTIAMRQNPYGSRTIPNPAQNRVCMTDDDPRHRAAFGAAWTLGLAAAIVPAAPEVWTPAALYGQRGLFGTNGRPWPLATVVRILAERAGTDVEISRDEGGMVVFLRFSGSSAIAVNLGHIPAAGLGPYAWVAE